VRTGVLHPGEQQKAYQQLHTRKTGQGRQTAFCGKPQPQPDEDEVQQADPPGPCGRPRRRTQRARTVMSTLADQCRTFTYDQARDLVDVIMKYNLQTNMTLDDMIAAMEQALKLRTCVIEELRIPQDDAVHPISYAGMAVQEVDWVMSREDMANFLSSGWLVIDDNDEDDPIDF